MFSRILLLVILLFTGIYLSAQNLLKGKVSNQDGQPLAGVNVLLHQGKLGTVTTKEGVFELTLPSKLKVFTVEFSSIGYKSKLETVALTAANMPEGYILNITLIETPVELQEITVTAGFVKEQEVLPYPITTMMKKELVSTGAVNLSQAIARTPGVYFSSLGNAVGKPVVRGLTNANIIMLNNGIKLENFNFSSNHPFLVDEFTASRIEVIKGPASLQYGSDAVGGVINVVRERPAQPQSIEGDFISHYNTNTDGYLNSLGLKGSTKNLFFGIRGSIKSHEDFKDGNNIIVTNTRFNERNFTASAGLRTNFALFSVNYNYTKPEYSLQNQNQINLFKNNLALPFLTEVRKNQVWYQNLTNHLLSSNSTIFLGKEALDVDLAYQMNKREGIGGMFSPQQKELVIPTFASMQLNTFTYNVKMNLPIGNRKFIFGVNGANIQNKADETKPNNPLLDSKVNDFGVYVISDFNLSERITFIGGLRYDFRNMKSFPTPTQTTNQFKIDNTYNNVNGSAGITYNFSPFHFIKANLARGFRSPTMPEMTQNGIHAARFERGNPNLKSQVNYQIDLNYHYHTSWITFDVSPFYNVVNNCIYLVLTSENAPIGQGKIFQHVQNDVTLAGGEVALDIHPLHWLGVHGSYSLVRADITNNAEGVKHPTFTPQDRITGEIKFEQKQLGFFKRPYAVFEVMHFMEQNRIGQNETVTPAYTLLNARIGTSITLGGQLVDIFINGNNLTNKAYIDHLSVTKQLNLNMIGRNMMFGLRFPLVFKRSS